jgi:hypothetical protein
MKSIVITGPLTDAEFGEVAALMRDFDERDPNRTIKVTVDDPDRTLGEARQAIIAALPDDPRRVTMIRVERYKPCN